MYCDQTYVVAVDQAPARAAEAAVTYPGPTYLGYTAYPDMYLDLKFHSIPQAHNRGMLVQYTLCA